MTIIMLYRANIVIIIVIVYVQDDLTREKFALAASGSCQNTSNPTPQLDFQGCL